MSYQSKYELLQQMAPRYREASAALKRVILDELVCGSDRLCPQLCISSLGHPDERKREIKRPRPPHYGSEVQEALHLAWTAANHICAKRLIPFLPTLVESLERHGHLHLSEEHRSQFLAMSPATADCILKPIPQARSPQSLQSRPWSGQGHISFQHTRGVRKGQDVSSVFQDLAVTYLPKTFRRAYPSNDKRKHTKTTWIPFADEHEFS